VPVELSRLDLSLPAEATVTGNISPGGARVASRQQWQEGDRVLLKTLEGDLRWQAKVVYCEILPQQHLCYRAEAGYSTGPLGERN
jgi:hypothetical protein